MAIINQASIQNKANFASNLAQVYALGTIANLGVAGWVFAVEKSSELELKAQVTNNYVQAGYSVQDHISVDPLKFTLRGYVSEIEVRSTVSEVVDVTSRVVGATSAFATSFTNFTKSLIKNVSVTNQSLNASTIASSIYNSAFDVYNLALNAYTMISRQAQIWAFFEALCRSGTLITIQTPWRLCNNMVITDVKPVQSQESRSWSEFTVTFQEFLITKTFTTSYSTDSVSTGAKDIVKDAVNNGRNLGKTSTKNVSVLKQLSRTELVGGFSKFIKGQ